MKRKQILSILLIAVMSPAAAFTAGGKSGTKMADLLLHKSSPLVTFRILFNIGSASDPAGKEGVAASSGNYLAEFLAKGPPAPALLAAISCGSVFMGANTYIGNGPNFMVKAIAEENGVKMPSFFGYMAYSGLILIPIFVAVTLVFFRA